MVYIRKSVSYMAMAAATAARKAVDTHVAPDDRAAPFQAFASAAAIAIFDTSPHKAPAAAALATRRAGDQAAVATVVPTVVATAVATAVAAGVAAAAVGWDMPKIEKISNAAAQAYTDNVARPIVADVAAGVGQGVKIASSRYPAVEAAAAAAYLTSLNRGGGIPTVRPLNAADAARDDEAAKDAAAAAGAAAFTCSQEDGGDLPYNDASYAAKAAARSATNRGVAKGDAVEAAACALATEVGKRRAHTDATEAGTAERALAEKNEIPDGTIHAAIAAAAAAASAVVSDSAPVPVPIGTFGAAGYFEPMPDCHNITQEKMKTILEVDTFLAGFLLFSLTGRKGLVTPLSGEEELQVVLQTFAFGAFVAATILTGMSTVCTGGRYALTSTDLIVPLVLSTIGFCLLLVTVADAIHIELEGGFHEDDHNHVLYWVTVGCGLGISVLAVLYGMFVYLHGYKYKWEFSCKCGGGRVPGIKAYRIVHTERKRVPGVAAAAPFR